jgi:hypothetical protein
MRTPNPTNVPTGLSTSLIEAAVYSPPTLIAPASRLVAVRAWAWQAEEFGGAVRSDFEILPVVAIRSFTVARFQRRETDDPIRIASSARGMRRAGWTEFDHDMITEAVVCDDQIGLVRADYGDGENIYCQVVNAAWPAEEDAERLSSVVEQLRGMAEKRLRMECGGSAGQPHHQPREGRASGMVSPRIFEGGNAG